MVRPKLSEMRMAWVLSGQASLTISRVVARWGLAGRDLEAVRLSGAMIGILSDDVSEAEVPVVCPDRLSVRSKGHGHQRTGTGSGHGEGKRGSVEDGAGHARGVRQTRLSLGAAAGILPRSGAKPPCRGP